MSVAIAFELKSKLMSTSAVRPRVLFLTDGYLCNGQLLDASRYSFVKSLADFSEAVCLFHPTYLQNDEYLQKLESTLTGFRPNVIIALNSGVLRQALLDYAAKEQIAIMTWYWDSPSLFGLEQSKLAHKTIVFHSDVTYSNHSGIDGVGEWMPFSSIPAVPYERKPTKDVCFQGTLWNMTRTLQDAALGLECETDGKYYFGAALYEALTERLTQASTWKSTTNGAVYSYGFLLNALSALKRAKTLSWFAAKDLHIYGEPDWLINLWEVAPELLSKCRNREAQTHEAMRALFSEHRCSLNVFHLQNKLGGPNLRILDSATHFTPILSDYNEYCEKLYPHGEAAYYFRSADEALVGLERILHEPGFGERLANNAAAILNTSHTHRHRIELMFSKAQLSCIEQSEPCAIQVVSNRLPLDLFDRRDPAIVHAQSNPELEFAFPPHGSFGREQRTELIDRCTVARQEKYFLEMLSSRMSEIEDLKAQIQRLEAVVAQGGAEQSFEPEPFLSQFGTRVVASARRRTGTFVKQLKTHLFNDESVRK